MGSDLLTEVTPRSTGGAAVGTMEPLVVPVVFYVYADKNPNPSPHSNFTCDSSVELAECV